MCRQPTGTPTSTRRGTSRTSPLAPASLSYTSKRPFCCTLTASPAADDVPLLRGDSRLASPPALPLLLALASACTRGSSTCQPPQRGSHACTVSETRRDARLKVLDVEVPVADTAHVLRLRLDIALARRAAARQLALAKQLHALSQRRNALQQVFDKKILWLIRHSAGVNKVQWLKGGSAWLADGGQARARTGFFADCRKR